MQLQASYYFLTVILCTWFSFASTRKEAKVTMADYSLHSLTGATLPKEWPLKAPFPWFGGKSKVATEVWRRFGNPDYYIEPFAGSLAVLLARPDVPKLETVNDKDGYITNFWRAVRANPVAVAQSFHQPCFEPDLHAKRRALVLGRQKLVEKLIADPNFCDPKTAAWWAWVIHVSIAPELRIDASKSRFGGASFPRIYSLNEVLRWFELLSSRLTKVRVLTGEWNRVVSRGELSERNGVTAVFLDPPYEGERLTYSVEVKDTAKEVRDWAVASAKPWLKIALCGHPKEHRMPEKWQRFEWKRQGGLAASGKNFNPEKSRECIWFSPACGA